MQILAQFLGIGSEFSTHICGVGPICGIGLVCGMNPVCEF